jgi:DNA-directed RNA polymerase specialized sigma24 family protein
MTGLRRDASSDRLADLYDRFAGTLFRHAAMILADRVAAADAVHNVFLKLAKAGTSGDIESLAYLRRAVRNECFSVMRTRRRDIVVALDRQLLELAEGRRRSPGPAACPGTSAAAAAGRAA